ncbi:hypothetical protein C943_00140 [Mariniradius saccharolyticus AK6]|uniref:Uncharacterized protein n=1 Tax=Mariniradius saccharolyticus AK6 TaxID=1239962 RepID=M7Y3T4_9BACT|nr:hypothetical protein C943_00140 [Mariniradius saccharolyticus AK6]
MNDNFLTPRTSYEKENANQQQQDYCKTDSQGFEKNADKLFDNG